MMQFPPHQILKLVSDAQKALLMFYLFIFIFRPILTLIRFTLKVINLQNICIHILPSCKTLIRELLSKR